MTILYLADGDYVIADADFGPTGSQLDVQLYDPGGQSIGPENVRFAASTGSFSQPVIAPLVDGGYVVASYVNGNFGAQLGIARFDAGGQETSFDTPVSYSGFLTDTFGGASVVGLPDGGYAAAWAEVAAAAHATSKIYTEEFSSSSEGVSPQLLLGTGSAADQQPVMTNLGDGRYEIAWTSPAGPQDRTLTEQSAPFPTGEEFFVSAVTTTLAASAGWTSAAVLSNGALAVVDAQAGGYGSHQGAEQTYDANGHETAFATLLGYASASQTLTPLVTALPIGGFYQVTYAGSSDYEIYNANDQRVFFHNQYTSPTATLSPLLNGGYVTTDSNSNVFGLFDANNTNVGWISMPSNAAGTPIVHSLPDGDFVFTYAGSRAIDVFDPSGHLLHETSWGGPVQDYATGFAPIGASGFLGAWIGDSIGEPGPPSSTTAVNVEAFYNDGSAITRTITVAQDLDPWHTQFNLQAHADGSVAILWSQGGAVFGTEYGAVSQANSAGVLGGDLAHTVTIQLPNDEVGFAWLQNNDAWAEIFNPATGAVQRVDLGPSSSADLATVHALATAQGGLAVSWHEGSGIEGAVLDAAGHLGPLTSLPGDLLGVNTAGQAVTLHDNGAGRPILQTYTLNDGLFWVA